MLFWRRVLKLLASMASPNLYRNATARSISTGAPINCKPRGTHPRENMGDLTASLYPEVGNLTMRWVTGVGHIDRRQSALWSPRVSGGAVWRFRLSPDGDLGYIWPPPWSNPHHLPGVLWGMQFIGVLHNTLQYFAIKLGKNIIKKKQRSKKDEN